MIKGGGGGSALAFGCQGRFGVDFAHFCVIFGNVQRGCGGDLISGRFKNVFNISQRKAHLHQ